MRRLSAIFMLIFCMEANAKSTEAFRLYGDIFQFLPAFAAAYSLTQEDYGGLGYLALGFGGTMIITHGTKLSFVAASKKHPNAARISLRPNKRDYDGFPSGHTSSAFSAAGFMQKRYGWEWGVPTTILATLVGVSRISAKKHTTLQVVVGAALGYTLGYFLTNERNIGVNLDIDSRESPSGAAHNTYNISLSYRF